MHPNIQLYGVAQPLPDVTPLRAGPFTLCFENGDLRYIRLGDLEVVRRIYVAIRDRNWGTVEPQISNLRIDSADDRFTITYDAVNRQHEIDYAWSATIEGTADGVISFAMDGQANSDFLRNRIGFSVLHPLTCAGLPCKIVHTDGAVEDTAFPERISPRQPFMDIREMIHEPLPGVRTTVRLEGDTFETEDQRNWIDASYKTYCTPIGLPFPAPVTKGTRIWQKVTLTLDATGEAVLIEPQVDKPVAISLSGNPPVNLPRIGLGDAYHGQPLSQNEVQRLRQLSLSHLRVDVEFTQGWEARLAGAMERVRQLGVDAELALFVSDNARDEMEQLLAVLGDGVSVSAWIILHIAEKSTTAPWLRLARELIGARYPDAVIAGGTNAQFTELNRGRPPLDALDVVAYTFNPQVHAIDNSSVMETLQTQAETVRSAHAFCGDRPLLISPITLKQRFNPDATGPEPPPAEGELPPQVDPRQMSQFGAAWTLGSIKYLAEQGVSSLTYYETTGWRGVMQTEQGSPLPQRFHSEPGMVYPLYDVLRAVGQFAGGQCLETVSTAPLDAIGFCVQRDGKRCWFVANLRPLPTRVIVDGIVGEVVLAPYAVQQQEV